MAFTGNRSPTKLETPNAPKIHKPSRHSSEAVGWSPFFVMLKTKPLFFQTKRIDFLVKEPARRVVPGPGLIQGFQEMRRSIVRVFLETRDEVLNHLTHEALHFSEKSLPF